MGDVIKDRQISENVWLLKGSGGKGSKELRFQAEFGAERRKGV